MHDDPRSAVTRTVYRNLKRAAFRECLTVQGPNGERPLIIALPTDSMSHVLGQVRAAGGSGNVVVQRGRSLMVLAVSRDGRGRTRVSSEGTVGAFIDQLVDQMQPGLEPSSGRPSVRRGDRGAGRPVSVPVCA
jgi:hypothetical protein